MTLNNLGLGLGMAGIVISAILPVSAEQVKQDPANFRSTQVDSPCVKLKGDEFIALSPTQTIYFSWSIACKNNQLVSIEIVPRDLNSKQKIYTTFAGSNKLFYSNQVGIGKQLISFSKQQETPSIVFSTYINNL